jgi:hypothetical protein
MKKGRTTSKECGTNRKEPQTRPRRNILRAFVTRSWNFKE